MPDGLDQKPQDDVIKIPVETSADQGYYLWIIIGCSIGGAVLVTLLIAAFIFVRRKTSKSKKKKDAENSIYIPGAEFCQPHIVPSSISSSSEDISETLSSHSSPQRPYGPFDHPSNLIRTTSECVQPKPVITRWHSIESTHYPTAAVPGTLDTGKSRASEDEESFILTSTNGRLWFSLMYNSEEGKLQITLIKAKYLPGRGLTNSPRDPFVKTYLLPDEETFHQSKIRKRTLSPKYNETFSFNVSPEEISHRTLRFSVYDVDKRKIRHSLGHVMFPLARADLTSNQVIWKDLDTVSQQMTLLGEIQISLGCNPNTNRIKATVGRMRNIQGVVVEDATLYVKVQLYHGHKLMKSKRTSTQKMAALDESKPSPQELNFDETFHFAVSGRFFDSCSFTFSVMVAGSTPLIKDTTHGRIVIGPFMYARGEQLQHWQEMLTNTRNIVTRWHGLEPVSPS